MAAAFKDVSHTRRHPDTLPAPDFLERVSAIAGRTVLPEPRQRDGAPVTT
ncbi:hypothetical protein QRX50_05640 [Amycolatopsis carbonis]|uniref:Uncharacterized protein n=1 Tax=Amycolatopsis carbonis TaxID=715471 RepID=A0A9Y2IKH2_9PSEU|nr:hypothetical protein [Amycolatopsis sp. 2-15]WIX80268.1 hypothetical protein QRX50_05640 [Amycolatopsis sp. 2-15]